MWILGVGVVAYRFQLCQVIMAQVCIPDIQCKTTVHNRNTINRQETLKYNEQLGDGEYLIRATNMLNRLNESGLQHYV